MMEVYGFVRFSIQLRELWDTGICTVKFLGFVKAFQQGCHPVIIIKSNRNSLFIDEKRPELTRQSGTILENHCGLSGENGR